MEVTDEPIDRAFCVERGINALKDARRWFDLAGAPQTLRRVRSTLKSAEGALRHAHGMASRASRADADRE
jgi:hypothetical protein